MEATLRPSRLARRLAGTAALATLALVQATPLAPELRLLASSWVAAASLHALRRPPPRALALDRAGRVWIDGASGRLCGGSFVAPWLTTLRWRPTGAWLDRSVLIVPDALGAEEFRRLRVLLRLAGKPDRTGPDPA